MRDGVYGTPVDGLGQEPASAVQFSPLILGAERLGECDPGSLSSLAVLAPPGTAERRYTLALGLQALAPGTRMVALAPKLKGGARLGDELRRFGCAVEESAKRHHRICITQRPESASGLEEAIAAGAPQLLPALDLWTQPGIFSWDRIDPGSALLLELLPPLYGQGADLGCGIGTLGRAVLASAKVKALALVDLDRRAIDAARRNIEDPRASFHWSDVQRPSLRLTGLDFVVMNPPFHTGGGTEDRGLGQAFIKRAAEMLRPGGVLWLTANRHLPYEAALKPAFKDVHLRAERHGYKIVEARR